MEVLTLWLNSGVTMSVVDDRKEIREDLDHGVFPEKLVPLLEVYRSRREDPLWRSSLANETLMEVAMYVQDKMSQPQT